MIEQFLSEASAMNWLEIIAVITAIAYVVLASMEKVACWFFGIISSILYIYIFYKVNYQLESILNVFYVIMGFYGWYHWSRGSSKDSVKASIVSLRASQIMYILIPGSVVALISGYFFDVYMESSKPYVDAFTTVFAMITTWMVARKILENWLFWIAIDLVSIYLYLSKGLYFTSFLFIVYIVFAVLGYITWRRHYQSHLT